MSEASLECPVCGKGRKSRAALMRHVATASDARHVEFVQRQQAISLATWEAGMTCREAATHPEMWFGYDWISRFWRSTFGAPTVSERFRRRLSQSIRRHHALHPDFNHLSAHRRPAGTGEDNPFFGRMHSAEVKARISQVHKGKVISEAQKAKFHDTHLKKYPTRESYSVAIKARYADNPEAKDKIRAARLKQRFPRGATKPERILAVMLQQLGVAAESQVAVGGVGIVDFRVGALILEVYGDYWHANPQLYGPGQKPCNAHQTQQVVKDARRNAHYAALGYQVAIIWERDILQEPEHVRSRLLSLLRSSTDETP